MPVGIELAGPLGNSILDADARRFRRHSADAEVLKSAARAQLELQLGLSRAQLLGLEFGQLLEAGPPLSALHLPHRLAKANLTTKCAC